MPVLHWSPAIPISLLAALPFLFTPIPPLIDVPGHIGGFGAQTAPAGSLVDRYFGFHWQLTLNLASDLFVQVSYRFLGLFRSVQLICAASAVLTAAGVFAVARALNPRGAYALPWALMFVFNSSLLWGFLNYSLSAALALLGFAAWIGLRDRTRLRAGLFLVVTPPILVAHGVGGVLLVASVVCYEAARLSLHRPGRSTLAATREVALVWPPVLACAVTLAIWKLLGAPGGGQTAWLGYRKVEAVVTVLRDQNVVLDIGSLIACAVVWVLGRRWGARLRGGSFGPVVAVTMLFVATPSMISGSNRIDTRLAPFIPLLAFASQDWSGVDVRKRRAVAIAGVLLLGIRFAVTTASFVTYESRYRQELAALDHVKVGARVLNLTAQECGIGSWRDSRLGHLSNLVTPLRQAWVNTQWSIGGLQLLDVRYRPSLAYYRDPSQRIWPERCIDHREPFARRDRHGLLESMPALPLDKVDYLWLIGARRPQGYHDTRLNRVWATDASELYVVRHQLLHAVTR